MSKNNNNNNNNQQSTSGNNLYDGEDIDSLVSGVLNKIARGSGNDTAFIGSFSHINQTVIGNNKPILSTINYKRKGNFDNIMYCEISLIILVYEYINICT